MVACFGRLFVELTPVFIIVVFTPAVLVREKNKYFLNFTFQMAFWVILGVELQRWLIGLLKLMFRRLCDDTMGCICA